jgi:imidazolonepropionase-like amidohydrolase
MRMRIPRVMGRSMLFVVVSCADPTSELARPPDHVLVDVTVIDGTGAAPKPGHTIEIANGRVTGLRPTMPGDSATVDVAGSFVTPGLIDAHVHLPENRELLRAALDSMLSLGITSTREMASSPSHAQFQSNADSIQFTRVYRTAYWAGPTYMRDDLRVREAYAAAGQVPWLLAVTDTTDLEAALRGARESGMTGIKMYSDLEPSLVNAIARSARAAGFRVWSHAAVFPTKPSVLAESGVHVISHAAFFVWEPPAEMPPTYNEPHPWNAFGPPAPYASVSPDDPAVVAVLATMREHGVILDPTITVMGRLSEEARTWAVNLTRSAHGMGIPIATGTDNVSLFEEIEALVDDVGLTPLEALASATSVAAAVIGVDGELGSLEVGKVADLVVYFADPSVEITALRRPSRVFRSGAMVRPRP